MVHALRGKEHVEWDNPYDVGMTGLIGFSSGYYAMRDALDVLADPLQRLARLLALAARRDRRALDGRAHHAASAIACWSSAARSTAAMMF
jgi:hypothetical protein